jgi:hypothetical protein
VAWLVLALAAGAPFGRALHGRSTAVVLVSAVGVWAGWAVASVALLVLRSSSLTAVRVLVPAGLVAVVAAFLVADRTPGSNGIGVLDVVALAAATVATVAALAPWVAEGFVDGSAYGPERRSPLRTPAVVLAVATVTWILVVVGVTAGPLLLAAKQWVVGGVALVAGGAVVAAGVRSLHQLARRWVVIVPAGLVLHDPLSMPEPQLFLHRGIGHIGPARVVEPLPAPEMAIDHATPSDQEGQTDANASADADAARPTGASVAEDLTAGASGLALELVLTEPVEVLVWSGRNVTTTRTVDRVLFTPVRPASVIAQARERRIPVA